MFIKAKDENKAVQSLSNVRLAGLKIGDQI